MVDPILFKSTSWTPLAKGVKKKKKSGKGTTTSSRKNPKIMNMIKDTMDCFSSQLEFGQLMSLMGAENETFCRDNTIPTMGRESGHYHLRSLKPTLVLNKIPSGGSGFSKRKNINSVVGHKSYLQHAQEMDFSEVQQGNNPLMYGALRALSPKKGVTQ